MIVDLPHYLLLSAVLFVLGFFGVLLRKNTLVIYMCLELMLIAATIALAAFSHFNDTLDGNVFVFFIISFKKTRWNNNRHRFAPENFLKLRPFSLKVT